MCLCKNLDRTLKPLHIPRGVQAAVTEIVTAAADNQLIIDPSGEKTGTRLYTLAMRLGIETKDLASNVSNVQLTNLIEPHT
ncbi:hypothetical protein NRB_17630 [Novosphingobium sp. 11B]